MACGGAHTLSLSALEKRLVGTGAKRSVELAGGEVYGAGNRVALGRQLRTFEAIGGDLAGRPCCRVACGSLHSAAVSCEGELFTWGSNADGCCGHSVSIANVQRPKLVRCLYEAPVNLCRSLPRVQTNQSSTFNRRDSKYAIDGDVRGLGEDFCTHTQREVFPWWEVDLGRQCTIDRIEVYNRIDSPKDQHRSPAEYADRLFPCWILASDVPFEPGVGPQSLDTALRTCQFRKRFATSSRKVVWGMTMHRVVARYIRVQVEKADFMHLAQVKVIGTARTTPGGRPVCDVQCGN